MASVVSKTGGGVGGGVASASGPDTLGWLIGRRDTVAIAALAAIVVGLIAAFYRVIGAQLGPGGFSLSFPQDWGHSYIVPLISGYYLWTQRGRLLAQPVSAFWPGLVLVVTGVVFYAYFVFGFPNHMFQGFAGLTAMAGAVLAVFGPRVFWVASFPIAYLALGVTISEQVMIGLTFKLQILASEGTGILLSVLGIDNEVQGNLLTVYFEGSEPIPLNVAEACSGMRMVIAFIALAVAVAFLSLRFWWQRIAVIGLAVPVALLMNVVRVGVLAVASKWDPDLATGEAHMLIGTLLLIPAFGLFMGCVWILNRVVREPSGVKS